MINYKVIFLTAGPVPLLPKPPAIQAYALIPIQGGVPMLSQPVLVQSVSQAAQVAQQALTGDGCNRNSPIPWATPEGIVSCFLLLCIIYIYNT